LNSIPACDGPVETIDSYLAWFDPTLASSQLWDGEFRQFISRIDLFEVPDDILDRTIDMVHRCFRAGLDFPFEVNYFVAFKRCYETLDLANSKRDRDVSLVSFVLRVDDFGGWRS
jgi:hypothetical protein